MQVSVSLMMEEIVLWVSVTLVVGSIVVWVNVTLVMREIVVWVCNFGDGRDCCVSV